MKAWAEWFYKSPAWRKCRKSFLKSKFGLCERCGGAAKIVHHKTYLTSKNINDPKITLSWSNLEALCQECHNKEHNRDKEVVQDGLMFTDGGDLVRI